MLPLLAILVLSLSLSGCRKASSPNVSCGFLLRWPEGRQAQYVVEASERTEVGIPGKPFSRVDMLNRRFEILLASHATPKGTALDLTLLSCSMEEKEESDGKITRQIAMPLREVAGAFIRYRLDAKGRIAGMDGEAQFMTQVLKAGDEGNRTVAGILDAEALRALKPMGWHLLPDRSARPGERWTSDWTVDIPGLGPLTIRRTHLFERWDVFQQRSCARIAVGGAVVDADALRVSQPGAEQIRSVEYDARLGFLSVAGAVADWSESLRIAALVGLPDSDRKALRMTRRTVLTASARLVSIEDRKVQTPESPKPPDNAQPKLTPRKLGGPRKP